MTKLSYYEQGLQTLEGKAQRLWWAACQNSRKRGQEEPTLEFFVNMLRKYPRCKWTGHLFTYPSDSLKAPSFDRIDSSKGYYEDNIHITTWQYNRAKGNKTDQELIEFCKEVTDAAEVRSLKAQIKELEAKLETYK